MYIVYFPRGTSDVISINLRNINLRYDYSCHLLFMRCDYHARITCSRLKLRPSLTRLPPRSANRRGLASANQSYIPS